MYTEQMLAFLPLQFRFYGHKEGVHCLELTAVSDIERASYTGVGKLIKYCLDVWENLMPFNMLSICYNCSPTQLMKAPHKLSL